jgi:hypothetical protein
VPLLQTLQAGEHDSRGLMVGGDCLLRASAEAAVGMGLQQFLSGGPHGYCPRLSSILQSQFQG